MSEVIDVHTHLYPQMYLDRLRSRRTIPRVSGGDGEERFIIFPEEQVAVGGRPMGPEYWNVEAKLEAMDRYRIDRALWSLGNPWLDPISARESVELARAINEEFDSLGRRTGGRVHALAVLPSGDIEAAIREVNWIAAQPCLHGVISGTRPCKRMIDDPELEPLWGALEAAGLVLFLHPHYALGIAELTGYGHTLPVSLGFPFETTVALARLALSGVLDSHPSLRLLAAHGGGTLPFLIARLDAGWRSPDRTASDLDRLPSESLRAIYADAVVYHPRALAAAVDFVGVDHVLFGTDHPFSISDPQTNREAIVRGQPPHAANRILAQNAADLFNFAAGEPVTQRQPLSNA